jgi:phosphotransferase system HPr (HPr) family protein
MSSQPVTTAEAEHIIGNQLGLHVRAAAVVVRIANRFAATLTIETPDRSADARSVLDLLTLAATKGTKVRILAEGPDATEAVAAVVALISQDFLE